MNTDKLREWEKEFDEKFVASGEKQSYPTLPKGVWLNMVNPNTVKDFIRQKLEEQEARHKDELEEIVETIEGGLLWHRLRFQNGYVKGRLDSAEIVRSHIK